MKKQRRQRSRTWTEERLAPLPGAEHALEVADLTPREEQVIRMRHGLVPPDELVLARKTNDPDVLSQLEEIELQLYRILTERSRGRDPALASPQHGPERD